MPRPYLLLISSLLAVLWTAPAQAQKAVSYEFTASDGEVISGIVAKAHAPPRKLVIIGHGYTHTVASWVAHAEEIAAHGGIAVVVDYDPYFDIAQGARWMLASTQHFLDRYPTVETVYLVTVSMGTSVAGRLLTEPGAVGLYDYWVNIEGLTNLFETWSEAKAVGHPAAAQIEENCGGTPATHAECYDRASPALHSDTIAKVGLRGAVQVHALNDGTVPYNQGRELATGLREAGLPVDFHTVLRGPCNQEGNTTPYTHFGLLDPLCTMGHGSEAVRSHPVVSAGFEQLFALLDGTLAPNDAECVIDTDVSSVPTCSAE